ncbi:hypothetical protein GCM10009591_29370 [Brachybacterium tyrofermentans]
MRRAAARIPADPGCGVHTETMQLPVVTLVFLAAAVVVALGILYAVAAPHLRERDHDDDEGRPAENPRHTSRTRR